MVLAILLTVSTGPVRRVSQFVAFCVAYRDVQYAKKIRVFITTLSTRARERCCVVCCAKICATTCATFVALRNFPWTCNMQQGSFPANLFPFHAQMLTEPTIR